jgi:hypothetical protein
MDAALCEEVWNGFLAVPGCSVMTHDNGGGGGGGGMMMVEEEVA